MARIELLHRGPAVVGSKPPLLFVHGVCHGAWCWEEFYLPFFAQAGWDAYAISLRGHGGSEGRGELQTFGLDDYVADVLETVATLHGKPILIGHSMGGGIAQLAMRRSPQSFTGIVLLASMPPDWRMLRKIGLAERLSPYRNPLGLLAVLRLVAGKAISARDVLRMPFVSGRLTQEQAERYALRLQPESKRAIADIQAMRTSPWTPPFPVMVIGSRRDALFGASSLRQTAAHYEKKAVILETGCHDLMLDIAWRDGADRILDWLQSQFRETLPYDPIINTPPSIEMTWPVM